MGLPAMIRRILGIPPNLAPVAPDRSSDRTSRAATHLTNMLNRAAEGEPIRREDVDRTKRLLESNPFVSAMGGDRNG